MSADGGSVKNTLGSESSSSSAAGSCGEVGGRRQKDYGRKDRKTVRILTVFAYILCVSMAAVLLSAYYVFIWSPGTTQETVRKAMASHHYPKQSPIQSIITSGTNQVEGSRYPKRSHHSYFFSYGNTRAYQQQQIPTPQPLMMTTQILTTLRSGIPTSKTTTTSPTPPIFKMKVDPMI